MHDCNKLLEELKAGNGEFRQAAEQTLEALKGYGLPEVDYFVERFLPAFGLTLDELVRDVDVADVRAKNVNNEKLDSIYSDINSAKKTIKWLYNCYLVVGGGIVALLLFFAFSAAFVW